uniref:Endonuclease/exonuclease/phosphatase domain-containing protein n=1 Tax=Schizaphis graminum TaxID=13262 RepID=A0A2S2NZE6_SCHGA
MSENGGVLLAINIKYNCIRIPTESIADIDFIFTLLNYNNCKLLLSCVFIPPNNHIYSYTAYCNKLVEKIISFHCIKNILIIGDFNIPGFMWSINEPLSNNIVNLVANSFINYLDLKQCNDIANHRQDILDLIFSDSQINNIHKSLSLTPIFDAYHPPFELIYP